MGQSKSYIEVVDQGTSKKTGIEYREVECGSGRI